jgi:hypothetical protein
MPFVIQQRNIPEVIRSLSGMDKPRLHRRLHRDDQRSRLCLTGAVVAYRN